jgi:assimilatory nitrate reductase catalytic subunit
VAIKPGSELALFSVMLALLIRERLINREFIAQHTSGWEHLRACAFAGS